MQKIPYLLQIAHNSNKHNKRNTNRCFPETYQSTLREELEASDYVLKQKKTCDVSYKYALDFSRDNWCSPKFNSKYRLKRFAWSSERL